MASSKQDPNRFIGVFPDRLSLPERFALVGKFVAYEVYTPESVPFRQIAAIGDSLEECVESLVARGLDPGKFEFTRFKPPY